jgi:hypothetical protein
MPESLRDRIRREWRDVRVRAIKWAMKRLIHRLDELNYGAFMTLSFEQNEHTTYHVIAERFNEKLHVYGTRVDYCENRKYSRQDRVTQGGDEW